MYNKLTVIGYLTKDAEIRYLPNGTPMSNFVVASNHKYKQENEYKEESLFIDTVLFGKVAESLAQYLNKGTLIFAEGRLQERSWENTEGRTIKKLSLIAQTIKLLSRKERTEPKEPRDPFDETTTETTDSLEPF